MTRDILCVTVLGKSVSKRARRRIITKAKLISIRLFHYFLIIYPSRLPLKRQWKTGDVTNFPCIYIKQKYLLILTISVTNE